MQLALSTVSGNIELADDARKLREALQEHFPDAQIRLRATGRYIHAEVCGELPTQAPSPKEVWRGDPDRLWRLAQISFVPPGTRGT